LDYGVPDKHDCIRPLLGIQVLITAALPLLVLYSSSLINSPSMHSELYVPSECQSLTSLASTRFDGCNYQLYNLYECLFHNSLYSTTDNSNMEFSKTILNQLSYRHRLSSRRQRPNIPNHIKDSLPCTSHISSV